MSPVRARSDQSKQNPQTRYDVFKAMQTMHQTVQTVDTSEADFKLSMLLNGSVLKENLDEETTKLSNDQFEVYMKNNSVVLVIDKRNRNIKRMYNDIHTAYEKVYG